ncbi:PREDICTED: IST1 homolog [Populus euphratica]|uniref:IST1 homolog n=1 Tax=Populus euphratica TaxID=75702 RepID=A0AAJ6Y0N3_POPEU|nr:PREDICTED: IST1 homolog [Populus euphratica]XP_011038198.1 PREDICTED: IST1 homolog [Populus euphratica]
MSMIDSFFNKGFKAAKCKTLLKLTIPRIKLLRNRREIQMKHMRRDIAKLLETGQEATARIRVEHIIREENMMAAQEIIELFCELISVRLPIIETQRECPLDLKEAISSVCFAAPRCADLPELQQVQILFASKYGKEFVAAATELMPSCGVNRQLIELLSVRAPSPEKKLKLLKEIAEEHELDWDPAASETELLKKHEDLLNGPTHITDPTPVAGPTHISMLPLPKEKHDEVLNSPDHAEHEQPNSDTDFDPLDFPEVPKVSPWLSANSALAPEIAPPAQAALHPDIDHESSNHSVTHKDLSQEPHFEQGDVIENKSVATRDEISSTAVSDREEKQFLPFICPPSLSSESFSAIPSTSPPSASRTESEANLDLQSVSAAVQGTVETAKHAAIPSTSPPSVMRTRTEANVDLQDVLAAAHAAAESAERAAAAARSAATLAQARISELTKKNSEKFPEDDNPFFVDTSDHSASTERPHFVHQQSFGDPGSVPNNVDSHRPHKDHQASELLDIPSFEKLEVYYDSPRSDHVVEQGSVSHQPQRLPSMDDEPYFSYPNLFTSQNSNLGSGAQSATDHSRSTYDL